MFGFSVSNFIAYIVVLLVAFPVHEFAHALTADRFGDDTPRLQGRLTLNPVVHLDPIGSLLLLFAGFGWAKPVTVNPYVLQRRSPSAMMWVSLAGPASNLLLAILAAIPFRLGLVSTSQAYFDLATASDRLVPTLAQLLLLFISINVLLMLFNLIPVAPLDGEKIAEYFAPPSIARVFDQIRPYGPLILMALVFLGVFGTIIGPPMQLIIRTLIG